MCGIIGYVGKSYASPVLINGLKKLEYRGYDSAGISLLNDKKIYTVKSVGNVSRLEDKLKNDNTNAFSGIGHTRWATHGVPSTENAHPHLSFDGKFSVVHNGIIENYVALRQELKNHNINFLSETDTEVVPNLIAESYKTDKDFFLAVYNAVQKLKGSFSLGIICSDYPDTVIAVKKSSPLIIGLGEKENYIASDITAIVPYTKDVIYLDDGEIATIKKDSVSIYDSDKNKLKKPVQKITWDIKSAEKCGYEHFMMKEIMQQPDAVKSLIFSRIKNGEIDLSLNMTKEKLKSFNRIIITACGSAYYAGCGAKSLFENAVKIPVEIELASELRYSNPVIDSKTLLIAVSQSGETADTIAAIKECKNKGAYTLSVVNVVGSTVAKISDDVLYTHAGPEIAVATTKGYSTQLAMLYLFGIFSAYSRETITKKQYDGFITDLEKLPGLMEETFSCGKNIPEIAKKYCKEKSSFFIGRNTDYACALEGSLKLKEISYTNSQAYAAGELKHGTISLIEDGTLVVALSCQRNLFDKTLSNVKEVKARGAVILAVTLKDNSEIIEEADDIIFVSETNPCFQAITEVIPLQLFAYYVAKEKNCDIDKPRNLAKSVTVA